MPPGQEPAALEISAPTGALLDAPLVPRARGAGPDDPLEWRARFRDDDGRVWRSAGGRGRDLALAWAPAKPSTGPIAALGSLRQVTIDLRVEAPDGRAAGRSVGRRLLGDGVRVRRWRGEPAATLHLPARDTPAATVLLDATAGPVHAAVGALAAPLLASRGALVLLVPAPRGVGGGGPAVAAARDLLAAVPGAGPEVLVLGAIDEVPLPPGVAAREPDQPPAASRAVAWDRLLARLGAEPRE